MRPGPRPVLGDHEAAALGPEQVGLRDPARLVDHLGVTGVAGADVAHHAHVAHQVEAGRVGGDDDHAGALVRRCVGVGDRHHDGERSAVGGRREPLLAVDHVVVAVLAGGGGEEHRVRSGGLGFGHREAAADLAGHERPQEPVTLFGGGVLVEDLDVARVGRLRAEHGVTERRASERFAQQAVLDHREALAAEVDGVVRRPQPHLADLLLRGGDERVERCRIAVEHLLLDRDEFPIDELVHHREDGGHLLSDLEVHGRRPYGHRHASARAVGPAGAQPVSRDGDEVDAPVTRPASSDR
jgi:hypothetical protein